MDKDERNEREARVLNALHALGIDFTLVHHKAVYTVAESKSIRSDEAGAHLKNLFLCCRKKRRFFLVIAVEHKRVDLKALSRELDVQSGLRFANEAHLESHLGVTSGAVSPFALLNDPKRQVEVIVDRSIFEHSLVNAHPLHNEATLSFSSDSLSRFLSDRENPVHHVDFDDGREVQ